MSNLSNQEVLNELKYCIDFAHQAKAMGIQNYPEYVVEYIALHNKKRLTGLDHNEKQKKVLLKVKVNEYFSHIT